jgi:hypothetical protein
MRTMQKFSGLNNVVTAQELGGSDLVVASNIDLDLDGRARRRRGYTVAAAVRHSNLWQASSFTLATRGAAGDLASLEANAVLWAAAGHARMSFADLPDGRVLFSNGTVQGIAGAAAATPWGVPVPVSLGLVNAVAGNLYPGKYQWALTNQRLVDGIESAPVYSGAGAVDLTTGGLQFFGIPVLAGHKTNVYLTSHYGGQRFFAGSTTDGLFTFNGHNSALQLRCPTDMLQPPPLGTVVGFWRGRSLVAKGNTLFASLPHAWEIFDLQRDFKQLSGTINLVQPVDGGIWVGTDKELAFLAGSAWDSLVRSSKLRGRVVPGSGVKVPGEQLQVGNGRAEGDCLVCIADGWLVAGTGSGQLVPLSVDRYRTDAAAVSATFRVQDGMPQYLASYVAVG